MPNKHFTVRIEREETKSKFYEWRDLFFFVPSKEDAVNMAEDFCQKWWWPYKEFKETITLVE